MAAYLSALIPSSAAAWYPLDDVTSAVEVTSVLDQSGNSRHLSGPGSSKPSYVLDVLNGRPVIRFAPSSPVSYTLPAALTVKDVWVVASYDAATFGAYPGLLGGSNDILVGSEDLAVFHNYVGTTSYTKNFTAYAENNMQGPMSGAHSVVQISRSTGWTYSTSSQLLVGFSDGADGNWDGDVADVMLFTEVLGSKDRRKLQLYYNLKFHFFKTVTAMPLEFPSPDLTGIGWARFDERPLDWSSVMVAHTYEDEGQSISHTTDTPPMRWEVGFSGLTYEEMEVFDAFNDAARRSRTFDFTDKWGVKHSGVRIVSYERGHEGHRSWTYSANFTLAKYY